MKQRCENEVIVVYNCIVIKTYFYSYKNGNIPYGALYFPIEYSLLIRVFYFGILRYVNARLLLHTVHV